ncbi:MAG TPA: DUF1028 domain-containing protein [Gaiellaceae bacterium]|nr:DUF1028 domain-containing protein [Gaiellaceae bacterium]
MSVTRRKSTFSIVAADLEAGEVGCAVQSRYFSVGSVVPWARAGVGAVATQAAGVAAFGPRALEELDRGASPEDALERVLADDPGRETRQLGIVTADGRAAAFTGAQCNDWAGHRIGAGFAAQGNILAGSSVVDEMARAYEETIGSLVERLVAALEAGQAAGGDKRGQQSAAVVVERVGARADSREGIDRVCDLRVEDHVEPITELRRLVGLWTAWEAQRRAHGFYERGDSARAADTLREALSRREDAGMLYNLACYESLAGRRDAALTELRRAIQLDPSFRELAQNDPDFDPIRADVSEL